MDPTKIKQISNRFELDRSKFELTRTQVHPPKPIFEPTRTPSKKPEVWSCLATNRPKNPYPNLEKSNFEPFRTQVRLPKPNYKPICVWPNTIYNIIYEVENSTSVVQFYNLQHWWISPRISLVLQLGSDRILEKITAHTISNLLAV